MIVDKGLYYWSVEPTLTNEGKKAYICSVQIKDEKKSTKSMMVHSATKEVEMKLLSYFALK